MHSARGLSTIHLHAAPVSRFRLFYGNSLLMTRYFVADVDTQEDSKGRPYKSPTVSPTFIRVRNRTHSAGFDAVYRTHLSRFSKSYGNSLLMKGYLSPTLIHRTARRKERKSHLSYLQHYAGSKPYALNRV